MFPLAILARQKAEATKKQRTAIKIASEARQATAYLDEGRCFTWTPSSGNRTVQREEVQLLELGYVAFHTKDRWEDIDKRIADAVYESMTFADYIGAGGLEDA